MDIHGKRIEGRKEGRKKGRKEGIRGLGKTIGEINMESEKVCFREFNVFGK